MYKFKKKFFINSKTHNFSQRPMARAPAIAIAIAVIRVIPTTESPVGSVPEYACMHAQVR